VVDVLEVGVERVGERERSWTVGMITGLPSTNVPKSVTRKSVFISLSASRWSSKPTPTWV
jgi:hypothetical protein